jgi:hypothetical protein
MKLYHVKFNYDCNYIKVATALPRIKFNPQKKSNNRHPDVTSYSNYTELEESLNNIWKNMSIQDALDKYPDFITIANNNDDQILTINEYEKVYDCCYIKSIINTEVETIHNFINYDVLAEKISNSLISKTGSNLFNNRLEIHQPNTPLFTYNNFIHLDDCCTDILQEHINRGYRVVAICPQPDQRRPDYILGIFIKEEI